MQLINQKMLIIIFLVIIKNEILFNNFLQDMEKEKFRYNKDFLQLIIERDNCIIDLDKIINPNKKSRIDFICNCGTSHNKGMLSLRINGGAFCIKCTNKNKIEKR